MSAPAGNFSAPGIQFKRDSSGNIVGLRGPNNSNVLQFKPALRQVANRCGVAVGAFAVRSIGGSHDHIAGEDLTVIQIEDAGWYCLSTIESTAGMSQYTLRRAVEYPINSPANDGVLTQVTYGGSASGTVPVGVSVLSDPVALAVMIPKGAKFRTRYWLDAGAGNVGVPVSGNSNSARSVSGGPVGDVFRYSVGSAVTDETMTLVQSSNVYPISPQSFTPTAIVALTSCKSVALLGDSRTAGVNDICSDVDGYIGIQERVYGPTGIPFINMGCSGERAADFTLARAPLRNALLRYVSAVSCAYGINDLPVGSASGFNTRINNIKRLPNVINKAFIGFTLSPSTTGAFLLADGSDQTVTGNEPTRLGINAAARAGALVYDQLVDVAKVTESQVNPGKWISGARVVSDGVVALNSYTVTSVTAAWSAANDIGKAVVFINAGFGTNKPLIGVVQTVGATTALLDAPCATAVAAAGTINIGDIYTTDGLHESRYALMKVQAAGLGQRVTF